MNAIEIYGKASGVRININKSNIMRIGKMKEELCKWDFEKNDDIVKILGINLGVNSVAMRDTNWTVVINKIRNVLNYWQSRKLTLRGKVIITNTMILSKLNYTIRVLDVPDWAQREIRQMVSKFIWRGKRVQIAYATL